MDTETLASRVAGLMPETLEDLRRWCTSIPSIAFPGYPDAPVLEMAERTAALARALLTASPWAEFFLWGAEDMARSRIHSSDESVDPAEIKRMILAHALLLRELGDARA